MPGKFTYALIRKEAGLYRSQGLPQEALLLYRSLLGSGMRFPPGIKKDIQVQLAEIENEIDRVEADEPEVLSDDQIAVIKLGWSAFATREELFTSAMALYRVGRLVDALDELEKLGRLKRSSSPA